jgi:succinoglycan biosynthesis transport protein ExoP
LPEEDEQQSSLNEFLLRITAVVTRRRWWILAPFCIVSLATVAYLMTLSDQYTSTATLLVVQQQVPQRYVVPNSTTDVNAALQAMKQEVLSRSQLLRMINDFGLYPKERRRLAPEQLIALMLNNIDIGPLNERPQQKDFDAFRISFTTENPFLAQQVTNTLTSLFINEYLRTGAEQATNTTNFLHDQVEQKSKELATQEERLRDFKMQHVGELPEQQQGNLGILTGLQGQLQNTMASLNRAQQQRTLLQSQLEGTPRRRPATFNPAAAGSPAATQSHGPVDTLQAELGRLEAARAILRGKGYTAEHPDVARNLREIAQLEELIRRARAMPAPERGAASTSAPSNTSAVVETDPAIAQLKSSLEANRLEIENLANDERRLKASIAQYESRINQTPVREQQQMGIIRDTEVLRQQYSELLKKEQESQLATNLEKQQGGQQFRLIDPASLPAVPSSPKRLKMSLRGAAAGLVLGLVLTFFLEMKDTSIHTEKELARHLGPALILGIPYLSTSAEEHRGRWRNTFQWVIAAAMTMIVAAAELYVYKRG